MITQRYPLAIARQAAIEVCLKLQPYCSKIHIAGSIRRRMPEVKDIEVVCLPKSETVNDMFGIPFTRKRADGFVNTIKQLGTVTKGTPEGKYMQITLLCGMPLDLFFPEEYDYFRQLAIRTGPAEYAAKVIAAGWKQIGWCGSDKGLRRMVDCRMLTALDGKTRWVCTKPNAKPPPVWQSEEEFFNWINVKMVHPAQRKT